MSVLAEQKSQLAKLMATENLTVQHANIRTAGFDTKNRVLYLPIWKDMNGVIYDLLGGHEVGHALYTPSEGWHNVAADKSKGKNYKSFLNVIEDARIEKKVKRKYPGLRSSFVKAYQTLMERDFFGIKYQNINALPFIDRLNIYTKSQYTADYIEFSDIEKKMLQKVVDLETWDDVVRVTDEIYEYSKGEQKIQQEFLDFSDDYQDDMMGDPDEYDYDDEGYDSDGQDEDADGGQSNQKGRGDKKADDADDGAGEESEDGDQEAKGDEGAEANDAGDGKSNESQVSRQKESKESTNDQFEPSCQTDDVYREREMTLLDDKCKPYVYVEIPKADLSKIVTPAKRVQQMLTDFYDNYEWISKETAKKHVSEFKSKNERYIGLLAKEFEMRKAAKAYSKSKISETGDLDIGKLATYKFNDNIFRKVTSVPKGKSHGLVLLLDRSGSMANNMAGSIEQVLVLAMFCRKVNIPFAVYGFGDATCARQLDFPGESNSHQSFEQKEGVLRLTNVYLREYLNSKMTNSEFSRALTNMVLLKKSYEGGRSYSYGRPDVEELSNTPLTQAIVAIAPVMQNFRKVNNLDITNLVIVHDGDADRTETFYQKVSYGNDEFRVVPKSMNLFAEVNIVRDTANKFEFKIDPEKKRENQVYDGVMQWFKHVTGSKVFGFYISPSMYNAKSILSNHYVMEDGKNIYQIRSKDYAKYTEIIKELIKQLRAQKFLANKCGHFDEFYFVAGGDDMKTEGEEIEIDGKVTAGKLKNAFMKFNKKKAINRVLVSKFIQGIAV